MAKEIIIKPSQFSFLVGQFIEYIEAHPDEDKRTQESRDQLADDLALLLGTGMDEKVKRFRLIA
jgi:hypothetical protein